MFSIQEMFLSFFIGFFLGFIFFIVAKIKEIQKKNQFIEKILAKAKDRYVYVRADEIARTLMDNEKKQKYYQKSAKKSQ